MLDKKVQRTAKSEKIGGGGSSESTKLDKNDKKKSKMAKKYLSDQKGQKTKRLHIKLEKKNDRNGPNDKKMIRISAK